MPLSQKKFAMHSLSSMQRITTVQRPLRHSSPLAVSHIELSVHCGGTQTRLNPEPSQI